jgi:hypothetical protein
MPFDGWSSAARSPSATVARRRDWQSRNAGCHDTRQTCGGTHAWGVTRTDRARVISHKVQKAKRRLTKRPMPPRLMATRGSENFFVKLCLRFLSFMRTQERRTPHRPCKTSPDDVRHSSHPPVNKMPLRMMGACRFGILVSDFDSLQHAARVGLPYSPNTNRLIPTDIRLL